MAMILIVSQVKKRSPPPDDLSGAGGPTPICIVNEQSQKEGNEAKNSFFLGLPIYLTHNDINATKYTHNVRKLATTNELWKNLKVDKAWWTDLPSPGKRTIISD